MCIRDRPNLAGPGHPQPGRRPEHHPRQRCLPGPHRLHRVRAQPHRLQPAHPGRAVERRQVAHPADPGPGGGRQRLPGGGGLPGRLGLLRRGRLHQQRPHLRQPHPRRAMEPDRDQRPGRYRPAGGARRPARRLPPRPHAGLTAHQRPDLSRGMVPVPGRQLPWPGRLTVASEPYLVRRWVTLADPTAVEVSCRQRALGSRHPASRSGLPAGPITAGRLTGPAGSRTGTPPAVRPGIMRSRAR